MPMPKPSPGHDKKSFIASFMANESMKREYPDEKQRLAVAYSTWEEHVKKDVYKAEESVYKEAEVNSAFNFIFKSADKGLVSGWASVAVNANGSIPLDWDNDIISPYELEDAAINFMLDYRESGVMHEGDAVGVIVESIVFTKEKQAAIGIPQGCVPEGWFITVKLYDMYVFEQVKQGKYKMFSIQGKGQRIAI